MTPPIRMVSVPEPLWMMHVIGPDDIYPAPDHETAVEWCAYLNSEIAPEAPDVLCVAVPAIWTGTAEEHANGLPEAIKGWTRPLTAAPVREEGGADLTPLADNPAVAALCDSNYRAGALAGWNAANHSDPAEGERIMARIRSVESGALAPIVERNRLRALATREEAPAEAGEAAAWLRAELIGRDDSEQLGVSVRRLRELLRAQPQAREEAQPVAWPETCDGTEQPAFEEWATKRQFDMNEHPLHYLFLDPKTDAARQGWKAGLEHAVERMKQGTLPAPEAEKLRDDVRRLVIAARNVAFDSPTQAELRALDIASEAFASRVPWEDEPEALAAAPGEAG